MNNRTLMSQGEVRPGMVQGQHWSDSVKQIDRAIERLDRAAGLIQKARRPTPASHADPRLSNPVER